MSESTTPVPVEAIEAAAAALDERMGLYDSPGSEDIAVALAAAVPVLLDTERERVLRELIAEVEAIDFIGTTPVGETTAEDAARYGASALSQPVMSARQGRVAFVTFLRARIAGSTTDGGDL
jgi:hypothetical protein